MTGPELVPALAAHRPAAPFAPSHRPKDYLESWRYHAMCSCGMTWSATAGRRAHHRRFGPLKADIARHTDRGHCVIVHILQEQAYNSRTVAVHIATALLSAFARIA